MKIIYRTHPDENIELILPLLMKRDDHQSGKYAAVFECSLLKIFESYIFQTFLIPLISVTMC